MRHFYEILSYDEKQMVHRCKTSDTGEEILLDIFVNGDLKDRSFEEMVGKQISVDYTYPYISIAMGVRVE